MSVRGAHRAPLPHDSLEQELFHRGPPAPKRRLAAVLSVSPVRDRFIKTRGAASPVWTKGAWLRYLEPGPSSHVRIISSCTVGG